MNKIECANEAQIDQKKPLFLSSTKYNEILHRLRKNEELAEQTNEENGYMEYLKQGSADLKQNWSRIGVVGHTDKTFENKKSKDQDKLEKDQIWFQKLLDDEEKARLDKIEQAKLMLRRQDIGPKELESAFMFSEVLKARDTQIQIQNEIKVIEKEKRMKDVELFKQQAVPWVEGGQQRILDSKRMHDEYKKELLNCIQIQCVNKKNNTKNLLENERKLSDQIDQEVRNQIEREKANLLRKKEMMRKNALEAMLMVEQRRQREKMEGQIEDQINCIYNESKREIAQIKKEKDKQQKIEKEKKATENYKRLTEVIVDVDGIAEKRYQNEMNDFCIKYDAQEKEKIMRAKELKAAKIKHHLEESMRIKAVQDRKNEEFKWSVANRLKNDEINQNFLLEQRADKIRKHKEVRNTLFEQIKEKKEHSKLEKIIEQKCNPSINDDCDKFFLNYGETLLNDVVQKSRPVYPILKTIHNYKKLNNLIPNVKVPPHLESNVPIGDACENKIKYDLNELKQLNPEN